MQGKRLFLLSLLAAGCQGPLAPGDTLSGHFSNADARLDVSGSLVVFAARCQRAEFGPIVLDEHRRFSAESAVFIQAGGIFVSDRDKLQIQGHFDGTDLVLQLRVIRADPPVADPYVLTLSPTGPGDPPVCNLMSPGGSPR
jgi:hypothetical protein